MISIVYYLCSILKVFVKETKKGKKEEKIIWDVQIFNHINTVLSSTIKSSEAGRSIDAISNLETKN